MEPLLARALRAMPVVVVTGARQTGKTTLANLLTPGRRYLTLDDIAVWDQVERDPASLLAELPVTLDEVQRAPALLLAVKRRVDAARGCGAWMRRARRVRSCSRARPIFRSWAP